MASDADGGVRRLVLVHGRDVARSMVEPEQRPLVDIASEVLSDDAGRIGITYTGFCLTGLPHKRLADDAPWEKRGHRVRLLVEPGRIVRDQGPTKLIGVPYGARARMILLYLQTQAVRTGSREVELGRSMRDWRRCAEPHHQEFVAHRQQARWLEADNGCAALYMRHQRR